MKVEMGKTYKTGSGHSVRLIAVDKTLRRPVIGVIEQDVYTWMPDGRYFSDGTKSGNDLVEIKPERTVWVNIYNDFNDPVGGVYTTRQQADLHQRISVPRFACVKVTYKEGEGL